MKSKFLPVFRGPYDSHGGRIEKELQIAENPTLYHASDFSPGIFVIAAGYFRKEETATHRRNGTT
jgi:hypothetical protein